MSQTWLGLSIIQGNPVMNPVLLQNKKIMGRQQVSSGKRSAVSLVENEFNVHSTIQLNNVLWAKAIDKLFTSPQGYYYITLKYNTANGQAGHAVAAYISPANLIYLEPETGMYQLNRNSSTVLSLANYYTTAIQELKALEYKIYGVH